MRLLRVSSYASIVAAFNEISYIVNYLQLEGHDCRMTEAQHAEFQALPELWQPK